MSKKSEKISDAIGELDEKIIAEADEKRVSQTLTSRRTGKIFKITVSAAACAALICGALALYPKVSDGESPVISVHAETLAEAAYPKMAAYPDASLYVSPLGLDTDAFDKAYKPWQEQTWKRREVGESINGTAEEFYKASAKEFLSGAEGENRAYSPVNVYMALAMLAETTDGNSRTQLLDLLGADSIEVLRERAGNMWTANYRNDGATTSILAGSIWLDKDINFKQSTVDCIAKQYFASVYRVDLSSEETAADLQEWLDKQTGGLLTEAVKNLELSPEAAMALCTTVYFRAKWDSLFDPSQNDTKTFHSAAGDYDTEFMNNSDGYGYYFWNDDFGAISLRFADDGEMWLILPDEDKTVDDILKAGDYLDLIKRGEYFDYKQLIINYSVPKFDISSEIDLKDGLNRLGVTDIFNADTADFTPLSDSAGLYTSDAKHAARVVIDEEGCTAAAFTEMQLAGGALFPEDEMDFILDRPFLFMIVSDTYQPLFIGEVNNP